MTTPITLPLWAYILVLAAVWMVGWVWGYKRNLDKALDRFYAELKDSE